jgi:hypothetical protein
MCTKRSHNHAPLQLPSIEAPYLLAPTPLLRFTRLEALRLDDTQAGDDCLAGLASSSGGARLTCLSLARCTHVTGRGLAHLQVRGADGCVGVWAGAWAEHAE